MHLPLSLVLVSALASGGPDAGVPGDWWSTPPVWKDLPDAGPPIVPPPQEPDTPSGVDTCATFLDACAAASAQNGDSCGQGYGYDDGGDDSASCEGTTDQPDQSGDDCAAPSGDAEAESCQVARGRGPAGSRLAWLLLPPVYLLRRRG
jgi:hypothetical protein